MHRLRFRFSPIIMISAITLPAAAAAEPLPPAPPPATPGPQPTPYPDIAARDPASGLPTGKRMHKPLIVASQRLEASDISWGPRAVGVANRLSSDPEEGGEVTAAKKRATKPTIGDIAVTKTTDVSSSKLMLAPEGGPETPPRSGSATVTVARGSCASGQHIKEATITVRGRTYQLHEVDVGGCTANSDGTDTCRLNYASIGI